MAFDELCPELQPGRSAALAIAAISVTGGTKQVMRLRQEVGENGAPRRPPCVYGDYSGEHEDAIHVIDPRDRLERSNVRRQLTVSMVELHAVVQHRIAGPKSPRNEHDRREI